MSTYLVTTAITLTATIRDAASALADPTTVVCTVKKPDGTTVTPMVTNTATGVYTAEITLDTAGTWYVAFQTSGAIVVAQETSFVVRATKVDA